MSQALLCYGDSAARTLSVIAADSRAAVPVKGLAAAAGTAGTVPMALPRLYLPVSLPSGPVWQPDSRTGLECSLQMVQMDTHMRAEAAHQTAAPATASAARDTALARL